MNKIKEIAIASLLLSIGLILPFITGNIPTIGVMLSPMHFPIIISGFILGPAYGALLGVLTPLIRSVLFSLPKMPNCIFMAFELMSYGFISGYIFQKIFKKKYTYKNIYISQICSMIIGRIVYGVIKLIAFKYILGFGAYSINLWLTDVVLMSIPGIIAQLIIIPVLIYTLNKRGIIK